tara:strand:- start:80 stop:1573 length:1494 start_codon:yes stop_codon:yes gene_type:complete
MAKVAVYLPVGLNHPEFEVILSRCQLILDKKIELDIILCAGHKGYACSKNIFSQKSICLLCNKNKTKGISKLKGKFNIIYTPKIKINSKSFNNKIFSSPNNLKKFKFENSDIGQSVYSSYLGLTRDYGFEGLLSESSCRSLLVTSLTIHDFFSKYLKKNRISKIILFNGRHNQYRPVVRIAQKNNIDIEINEFFESGNTKSVRKFKNHLPGDIDNFAKDIDRVWKKSAHSKKAINYFRDKYQRKIKDDTSSYVLKQEINSLPDNWDKKKRNIVYFTSSQDEYAALGGEYDKIIYKDQFDSIKKISDEIKRKKNKEIFFWIKCHPNLSNVFWNYHKKVFNLHDPANNIHVIPPSSKVDTYSVLKVCEKAITFNSLIGIESVYWRKPSIIIGRRVYEKLNCIYKPKNHSEVMRLVLKKNLKPKSIIGAYKYSVHWVDGGSKLKYLSGSMANNEEFKFKNFTFSFKGLDVLLYKYEKFKQFYIYNYLISYLFIKTLSILK